MTSRVVRTFLFLLTLQRASADITFSQRSYNLRLLAMAEGDQANAWLFLICPLLSTVHIALSSNDLFVSVTYLQPGNYSLVRLICTDFFGDSVPADFKLNGTLIGFGMTLVTVTDPGSHSIEFIFTQSQEGFFSCESGGTPSEPVGLAGIIFPLLHH